MIELNGHFIGKVPPNLHVTEELLFSLPKGIEIILYGHVRRCVKLLSSYFTIFVITKTRLFKYIENFTTKNWQISEKILIFFIFLIKNIDWEYSLEPLRQGGSKEYPQSMFWAEIRKIMYTPVNPSFTI